MGDLGFVFQDSFAPPRCPLCTYFKMYLHID
jgi:hypothetical protein